MTSMYLCRLIKEKEPGVAILSFFFVGFIPTRVQKNFLSEIQSPSVFILCDKLNSKFRISINPGLLTFEI